MLRQYLRRLPHESGEQSHYDGSHQEEAEYPEHVPERSPVGDRERRNGPRDVRGGVDVDLASRHSIAKVPRDPGMWPDTKCSPGNIDITADYTVEGYRTAIRQ